MRRSRLLITGLILLIGLATAVVIWRLSRGTREGGVGVEESAMVSPPTPAPSYVVITTQHIPQGESISEERLQLVPIPQEYLLASMFSNLNEVVGTWAKFDLAAGIYLSRDMVVANMEQLSTENSDTALLIPPGMVGVSIPIDRLASISFGVQSGDHVTVYVTILLVDIDISFQSEQPNTTAAVIGLGSTVLYTTGAGATTTSQLVSEELLQSLTAQIVSGGAVSPIGRVELDTTLGQPFYVSPSEAQRPRIVSQTLIQDAIVLKLGSFPTEPPAMPPDAITLMVSPQDSVTLNYLISNNAMLSLGMRSAMDRSDVTTQAVTLQFLIDQYNIPVPAKLPFGVEPRTGAKTTDENRLDCTVCHSGIPDIENRTPPHDPNVAPESRDAPID